MPKLHEVIAYLRPNAEWSLIGESITDLIFTDESIAPITKAEYTKGEKELIAKLEADKQAEETAKAAILERLGLTEAEAKLLLA